MLKLTMAFISNFFQYYRKNFLAPTDGLGLECIFITCESSFIKYFKPQAKIN